MSLTPRVPLYDRLPEIYRLRDAELQPPDQLRSYLAAVEEAFSAIHENIESLYHDLFIDTCDDWVIPYVADLVGTSHLNGETRALRADVADTIALRRRKGTLGVIERLAANLTGWAARCVELRENLDWTQHLNHQRPDAGGVPPHGLPHLTRFTIPRGGTLPIRDPAQLSLLGTPFDTAAYTADVKPANDGAIHCNLPNLAIFLWRLEAYRLRVLRPLLKGFGMVTAPTPREAAFVIHVDLHPLDRRVRGFNTLRNDPTRNPPRLTQPDQTPGPIPYARLTTGSEAGNPTAYVGIDTFDPNATNAADLILTDAGLQLFLPENPFSGVAWTFRGDNLCAWETGLRRRVGLHEIVVDPDLGRVAIGVGTLLERNALTPATNNFANNLRAGFTYGAVGPIGAHPISRPESPTQWQGQPADLRKVNGFTNPGGLAAALANIQNATSPIVIEIQDSLVHELDLDTIPGTTLVDGPTALQVNRSLIIRATGGNRPIVRLAHPLRFRPTNPGDPTVEQLTVRFEGIYLTRAAGFPAGEPLVARAAVARLEFLDCTLDPGGFRQRNFSRAPLQLSLRLASGYGFAIPADETAFSPTPRLLFQRTITGALHIDEDYRLDVEHSIIDAGRGVSDPTDPTFALADATGSDSLWGPALTVTQATFFGRVRVAEAHGAGGLWVHRLEVHNHQKGCLKFSYFRGDQDRLPPNHACVSGADARLAFTSEWFEDPGYGQLALACDSRILQRGPGDDQMGAFGFVLREAHKWINLNLRLREFMPVGVRPLLIAVT